jgi:autophagy-related protein 5
MNYYGLLDERLQESVWETRIPLKIKMSPKDLISSNVPITLYYSLPRISYLSSIFGDIIKNFEGCVQVNLSDLWIECENKPLRWQYPLGVLVDSLGIDTTKGPITLTVRLREMPSETVLQYESLDSLRFYFFNAIKEADVIRYPMDKKVFNLKNEVTERLKNIVYENNPKNITDYRKIMNFDKKISKYPVKIFFCRTDIVVIKSADVKEGNEVNYTIGDFLKEALTENVYEKLKDKCRVVIHGLDIEENMSFLFYYFNFSYLDTFLYITFVDKIKDEL